MTIARLSGSIASLAYEVIGLHSELLPHAFLDARSLDTQPEAASRVDAHVQFSMIEEANASGGTRPT